MNLNLDLKENLSGNSSFVYFRDGALWYRTSTGMLFPIPAVDLVGVQILATEKSMVFMKWIRLYIMSQSKAA